MSMQPSGARSRNKYMLRPGSSETKRGTNLVSPKESRRMLRLTTCTEHNLKHTPVSYTHLTLPTICSV
eukprot:8058068-Alexandrium_andersonii.AAC.1